MSPRTIAHARTVLCHGERLTQAEFHRLNVRAPAGTKAELIEGVVAVAPAVRRPHGRNTAPLATVLQVYENSTPGTECGDNSTVIIDESNEFQPDLLLFVLPEFGGRIRESDRGFLTGPPEFVIEVADRSIASDRKKKRQAYTRAGVAEYLLFDLRRGRFQHFDLRSERERSIAESGILVSLAFPGLWIDTNAIIARNAILALATLQRGLESPEHAAFVVQLQRARQEMP
jgi:Uma2 family endonuclease